MRRSIAIGMLAWLCAVAAGAVGMGDVVLSLSRSLRAGEQLSLAVSVGPIGRQRVEISTAQGQHLGTISLFGVPAGRAGGTYTIPVPAEEVHDGRLELHLAIISGSERRSPTAEEVTGVRLILPGD
jgi:hypothetical protein